jgi:adenine/guanine/hypoxanthine permease
MPLLRDYAQLINESVSQTTFGRVFRLQGCGHVSPILLLDGNEAFIFLQKKEIHGTAFLTELRAGITTFATMAYIIAVNVKSDFLLGRKILT